MNPSIRTKDQEKGAGLASRYLQDLYDLISSLKIWMDRCMDGMDRWASFSALSSSGVAGVQGASARYSNIGFPNIHFYIGTFSNWTNGRLRKIFLAKLVWNTLKYSQNHLFS